MPVTVAALFTYPLKSGAAQECRALYLNTDVTAADRRWMVVQDGGAQDGRFLSQRDKGGEKLARVQVFKAAATGHHVLRAPGMRDLDVYTADATPVKPVELWGQAMKAVDEGDKAAAWFSAYLGRPARLVQTLRGEKRAAPNAGAAQDFSGFADGYPLLVTARESLDALNAHMAAGAGVPMDRFRPNIVLTGDAPFREDEYALVRIGQDAVIEFVKPCARCKTTTVDQATGVMADAEPLATLAKTRKGKADGLQGVFFGQNAIVRVPGVIRPGDTVTVLSTRPMHPALQQAALKAQP